MTSAGPIRRSPNAVTKCMATPRCGRYSTRGRSFLERRGSQPAVSRCRARRREVVVACSANGQDKHSNSSSSVATTNGIQVIAGESDETSLQKESDGTETVGNGWSWNLIVAEMRIMMTMSVSIVSAQVGLMMLGIVDTMTISRYNETCLAGVSTGSNYSWLCHSGMSCFVTIAAKIQTEPQRFHLLFRRLRSTNTLRHTYITSHWC